MSEVATISTPANTPAVQTEAIQSLVGWSTELDAAYKLATMICNTSFVPQHFRGKPEETAVAMLYGHTLELPPMVAVKSIYVVHGTPALYAQTMFAIALSKGHEIERVHADDERVEFRARRRGLKSWQKVEWTLARAEKAKYTSNSKYRENPIGMLTEKCKAEAAKLVAPDALAGLYAVEEIELGDYEDTPEVVSNAAPAVPKTTIKRRTKSAPAPSLPDAVNNAPRDEEEPPAEEPLPVATEEPKCSRAQQGKLSNALEAEGHTTKAEKLAVVTSWVGRDVASAAELTVTEANDLTKELEDSAADRNQAAEPVDADADAAWLAGGEK